MDAKLVTIGGLRTAFVPCEAESVAVGLFVASGSRHEPAKLAGISHLIEHMLFKGTPTRSALDITRAIEGRGGNFNAWTSEDSTCYYAHLPCEYLDEAVDFLADMYLNAALAPDEFAREREVVLEEIKMYEDDPGSVAAENLQGALFPLNPLGRPVAGSGATLSTFTPETLRAYIASHYTAATTVLVIAGRFVEEDATNLVRRAFQSIRTRRARKLSFKKIDWDCPPVAEVSATKDVKQTQLALGYRTFGVEDPRRYAATVMDAILGRGMSSRLFQEVREKRGLSYDISSRMQFFQDVGLFTITAGLDPRQAGATLATVDRELRRLIEKKVGAAELKRTKEFLVGNFRLSHERVTSKMFYHGAMLLSRGRLVDPEEEIDGVRAVTAEEVQAVAREIFTPGNRSLSRVDPK